MIYPRLKRACDLIGAALGLLVLGPLIVVTACLVLAFHGAPIIFTQERVTQGQQVFRLKKFRSMRSPRPDRGWTSDAARLTIFGRFIRTTSIDELPSLWNVLVGDMSLIGPRPLTTDYLSLYTPEQSRRHEVRGGLSGLAQVSGRNALSWDDRFDLDLAYVETMSLRTDLRILLRTIATVLRRQGVSHPGSATMFSYGGSLRSELVDFRQIAKTRELTQWMARTRTGERIGLCEMVSLGESARMIRFVPSPPAPSFDCAEFETLSREVLRLLLNRARGADADFAFCHVSATAGSNDLYFSSGFRPVAEVLSAGSLAHQDVAHSGDDLLCCVLRPEELTNTDMRLAS